MTTYGMDGARMTQYTQRISDQQREIEAAAVREAELRTALTEAMEKVVDNFGADGVAYDAIDIDRWEVLLAQPSPLADAAGDLIEAAVNAVTTGREIAEEGTYNSQLEIVVQRRAALLDAVDAYRALRDSMPLGYGTPEADADGGADDE